jgi:hypothetical protein
MDLKYHKKVTEFRDFVYNSGSHIFRSTAPLFSYTHPQCPPTFFNKHKCAVVSTFLLYLKILLNKIIRVKLNVYVLINKLKFIIFYD